MRRSSVIAVIVLICCAIAIVVIMFRPTPVPDTQQIQDQLASAVQEANQHSIGGIMSVVSINYHDTNGLNSEGVRNLLGSAFRNASSISVTNSQPVVDVTGDTATSSSQLTISPGKDTGSMPISRPLNLQWKKERTFRLLLFPDQVWHVVGADYGPVSDIRSYE